MSDFSQLHCRDPERRQSVLGHATLNGIDYLEISAASLDAQRFLHLYFLNPLTPAQLQELVGHRQRFRVEGGVRERNLRVLAVTREGQHLKVEVDRPGDFSTYTLILDSQSAWLDPAFARCDFSFKAGCPSRFDCKPRLVCPPEAAAEPLIDYLAKDYASFRRALLDLIPSRVPGWKDRHEADLGMALVELLAYAGDHLSYHQDAVANEAYLETARQRISVRRHARLVDYAMHDGASARTFVHFKAPGAGKVPAGTAVVSRIDTALGSVQPPHGATIPKTLENEALRRAVAAFETMAEVSVHSDLNKIRLHDWGNSQCCLPRGATAADLAGDLDALLAAGDFLLFEEIVGPETGLAADADPAHRQVVRLRKVETAKQDPLLGTKITRVTWDDADALTFPLCVSARLTAGRRQGEVEPEVSVARGNLALADHGRAVRQEQHAGPETAKYPSLSRAFRVKLKEGPLSFRVAADEDGDVGSPAPVRRLLATDPHRAEARVAVAIESSTGTSEWKAQRQLLGSRPFDRDFAVETDNDGRALLRFGDGEHGLAPPAGSPLKATYRVGVGTAGNVGAEGLEHVIDGGKLPAIERVRNPLPAWGGTDPEPLERVRRLAPAAFRASPIRAVTEADYARAAGRHPEVAKAAATFRWTGSWHTVYLTVDRKGGKGVDAAFEKRLRAFLARARLAGYDLEIDDPIAVPLEIEIDVCVARDHFRGHVEAALLEALSNRALAGGRRGFFHPDNLTFGQPLRLSRLYAAVEAVDGVDSAEVRVFKRLHRPAAGELQQARIPIGRLEIARLDNDPSRPENGVLRLHLRGGK